MELRLVKLIVSTRLFLPFFDNNYAETLVRMNVFCLRAQKTAAAPLHSLLSDLLLGKLFLIVCDS